MSQKEIPKIGDPEYQPYDGKNLSYAGTFTSPLKVQIIKIIEITTGKIKLMRLEWGGGLQPAKGIVGLLKV